MKDILIVLPTRSRPEKIKQTVQSWRDTTSGYSDLLLRLDDDDPELLKYPSEDVLTHVGPRLKLCPSVNEIVNLYPNYKYYAYIGDDHVFRTKNWENIAIEAITKIGNGWGIVYGNDLNQGQKLATACIMSGNIIKTLGYMAIPGLVHLYMDNFWMDLGNTMGFLFYTPSIVIEHMHFSVGKSEVDPQYLETNSSQMYSHDSQVFMDWHEDQREKDIEKIKDAMGKYPDFKTAQIPGLKDIYQQYLGIDKGFFVEAGAYDGRTHSNTAELADIGWGGLYIEPVEEYATLCEINHANDNTRTICSALGNKDGTTIISVAGEISTTIEYPDAFYSNVGIADFQGKHIGNELTVPVHKLNTLLEQEQVSRVDLLVLDTEGTEAEILQAFDIEKYGVKMAIIEMHELSPNWNKLPLVVEANDFILKYFVAHHYKQIYKDDINSIFVKE